MEAGRRHKVPMRILDDDVNYFPRIYDWIVYPPIKSVVQRYGIHPRLVAYAEEITTHLLKMFFRVTVVNDFSILNSLRYILSIPAGSDDVERMRHTECFLQLIQHETRYDALLLEAFLEDKGLCTYPRAWIGYAYTELWPFLVYPTVEASPGIHAWREGKRIIQHVTMAPLMTFPMVEDDIYS